MKHFQTVVLSDVHAPFHNKQLLPKVCQLIHDIRPQQVIILGDFGEFASVSRHQKGSLYKLKDITLGWEYEQQNELLDAIDSACRGCQRDFIEGNHEQRVNSWLEESDNGKIDGAISLPQDGLNLYKRGWKYHSGWKEASVKVGKYLEVVHGEYCPVHAAKKHLDEYEGSVMMGHTHRFQSYVTGKRGSYNIGCLIDRSHPVFGYASASQRRKWVNGFAVVTVLGDGSFIPHPIQCWNDRFAFGGKLY